ncbi:MAG TPA: DinB family protein [bacterium]|nr:DinB family protein [bacterium]
MADEHDLRRRLVVLLQGGRAHVAFDKAVARLPEALRGRRPRGLPYSPWQQVEHIRITQADILGYTRDPKHPSLAWPEEYWPKRPSPPSRASWDRSIKAYRADRQAFCDLVMDPAADVLAPLPHDPEVNIVHMALLAAQHTSYHVGQLLVIRRLLGAWSG